MLNVDFLRSRAPLTILLADNASVDEVCSGLLVERLFSFLKIECSIKTLGTIELSLPVSIDNVDFSRHICNNVSADDNIVSINRRICFSGYKILSTITNVEHPDFFEYGNFFVDKSSCTMAVIALMRFYNYPLEEADLKLAAIGFFDATKGALLNACKLYRYDKRWLEKNIADIDFLEKITAFFTPEDSFNIPIKTLVEANIMNYAMGKQAITTHKCSNVISSIELSPAEYGLLTSSMREHMLSGDKKFKCDAWVLVINLISLGETLVSIVTFNDILSFSLKGNWTASQVMSFISVAYNCQSDCCDAIVQLLKKHHYKIATMESCTSGLLASTLTDVNGASDVFEGGDVTYSNKYKVARGVDADIINEYGVYSPETAYEMAKKIRNNVFRANIGIGVTGTAGTVDKHNADSMCGIIFSAILLNNEHLAIRMDISHNYELKNKAMCKQHIVDIIWHLFYAFIRFQK